VWGGDKGRLDEDALSGVDAMAGEQALARHRLPSRPLRQPPSALLRSCSPAHGADLHRRRPYPRSEVGLVRWCQLWCAPHCRAGKPGHARRRRGSARARVECPNQRRRCPDARAQHHRATAHSSQLHVSKTIKHGKHLANYADGMPVIRK
jgi:hypothetical protein